MGWDTKRFASGDSIIDDLICSICTGVLDQPLQAPCEHSFCKECIQDWLGQGKISCPIDQQQLSADLLKAQTRIIQQLLNNLTIRCQNYVDGCHLQCKLEYIHQLTHHEQKWCQDANNEKKREINYLKKKILEMQDDL